MEHIWSREIDEILSVGGFLGVIGVRNWLLTRHQALVALEELAAEGVGVLGGDVYLTEGQVIRPTPDGWHSDRDSDETDEAFVDRSVGRAREYIGRYPEKAVGRVGFAIVPARRRGIDT
jgi:hypothetical protein